MLRIFRVVGVGFLVIAVAGVLMTAYDFYWNTYQSRQVVANVQYSHMCPSGSPLLVEVKNQSRRSVADMSFFIAVRIPGHSADIAGFPRERILDKRIERIRSGVSDNSKFSSDRILSAGGAAQYCRPVPVLNTALPSGLKAGALEYNISTSVRFMNR